MKVDLILVEYDSGKPFFRMGNGPQRLLDSGLSERLESAGHTVRTKKILPEGKSTSEAGISFDLHAGVSRAVASAIADWSFPLVLSGNCSSALGTMAGLRAAGSAPAVCWLDAHADFNTPDTTRTGFLDGMTVATLTGRAWKTMAASIPGFAPVPEWQIVLVGGRDIDSLESAELEGSGIVVAKWKETGSVFDSIRSDARSLYFHIDLDVLDTSVGKANSYAVSGGMTVDDVLEVMESARRRFDIVGASLTAYDPVVDPAGRIARAAIDIAQALLH
ncbi:MAG: arginase family protein [Gemmatimonadota bacterium]|nr:arginase family protein [Gemmatimonadota bacterium]